MTNKTYDVNDTLGCIGIESPRKPTNRAEVHIKLSKNGVDSFANSLELAFSRQRQSTIVITCGERPGRGRIKFIHRLQIEVPSVDTPQAVIFELNENDACLTLPRSLAAKALEICDAMRKGIEDTSFKLGDVVAIWVWGGELEP